MYQITTERPEDEAAIEQLLDKSFGANRHSKMSYRYRDGIDPVSDLRLVARDADAVVGTLRFWPVEIGLARTPALLLGPLAVTPTRQGEGIGGALMRQGLDMALWARHRIIVLVGDYGYYARFGFRAAWRHSLIMPGERMERLLVHGLVPDALAGVAGAIQPWRSVRVAA
jgi:predicted N-acetyltransferase YhbS